MPDTFQNRLNLALKLRGKRASDLAKATGLNKGKISHYVNGRNEARSDALYLISQYLDVSEGWLQGFDVPMERSGLTSTDDVVRVALFGGDGEVTDEMWNEVKNFAQYIKHKYESDKLNSGGGSGVK